MITKTHFYTYRNCDASLVTSLLMQGIVQVQEFAQAQGYRQLGNFPSVQAVRARVQGATPTLRKRLLKRVERLQKKINLRVTNQFLHLMCTRLLAYGADVQVARVEVSEKEAAIQSARKAWVKARTEAEGLRLAYIVEKGDFYRRSV